MRWEVITDPHPEIVNYKETGDNRQCGHGLCALGPDYIQLHSFTHKLQVSPVCGGSRRPCILRPCEPPHCLLSPPRLRQGAVPVPGETAFHSRVKQIKEDPGQTHSHWNMYVTCACHTGTIMKNACGVRLILPWVLREWTRLRPGWAGWMLSAALNIPLAPQRQTLLFYHETTGS